MFSIVGTIVAAIVTILTTLGLAGLFALMVVESFGIPPLPSEVILPFAGFLVATGVFPLVPTLVVAVAGALVGSFIAYSVGRWWRDRVTHLGLGPIRLEERHLQRVDDWFARHGEVTVALARLVPVVRAYVSYPAGTAKMPPVRFGVYTLAGMVPFTLGFVYAGILLGSRWGEVSSYFQYLDLAFVVLVGAGIAYLIFLYLTKVRGRAPAPAPGAAAGGPAPSEPPRADAPRSGGQ